ncbi:Nef-associated protein, partial [Acrasis kona]
MDNRVLLCVTAVITALSIYLISNERKKSNEERKSKENMERLREEERRGRIKAEKKLRDTQQNQQNTLTDTEKQESSRIVYTPIGYLESVFRTKNGCPRQGLFADESRAILKLQPVCNGSASLQGLEQFSHCWLIFVFHENTNQTKQSTQANNNVKSKISPPRLKGQKVGLYATRTPHRHNNIGLSCAQIHSIDLKSGAVHLRGVDLIDGTPILDIKPYIDQYDNIPSHEIIMPDWIKDPTFNVVRAKVVWEEEAEKSLRHLIQFNKLMFFEKNEVESLQKMIDQIVRYDMRSVHKSTLKSDSHSVSLDRLNIDFVITVNGDCRTHTITKVNYNKDQV